MRIALFALVSLLLTTTNCFAYHFPQTLTCTISQSKNIQCDFQNNPLQLHIVDKAKLRQWLYPGTHTWTYFGGILAEAKDAPQGNSHNLFIVAATYISSDGSTNLLVSTSPGFVADSTYKHSTGNWFPVVDPGPVPNPLTAYTLACGSDSANQCNIIPR